MKYLSPILFRFRKHLSWHFFPLLHKCHHLYDCSLFTFPYCYCLPADFITAVTVPLLIHLIPPPSLYCRFPPSILSYRRETRKSQPKVFQNLMFSLYGIYESPTCTFWGLVFISFSKRIVFTDYKNINLYIDSLDTLFSSEISLALWLNSNIFTVYGQQNKTEHVNMVQGLQ